MSILVIIGYYNVITILDLDDFGPTTYLYQHEIYVMTYLFKILFSNNQQTQKQYFLIS